MAVRSITFALSAEREHVRLLEAARQELRAGAQGTGYYVCPFCGKTVASKNFSKCPNCFTSARKFVHET
jgi:rubrerythrin